MAKPPAIPYALIENMRGEDPVITQGFLNVVIFWIKRGIIEPLEEARIEKLSLLAREDWKVYEGAILERIKEFTGPFIEHWERHSHKVGRMKKMARTSANKWTRLNEMLKNHVTNVTEATIKDSVEAFSISPVKLERTTRHNIPQAHVIRESKPKKAMVGTLKDET